MVHAGKPTALATHGAPTASAVATRCPLFHFLAAISGAAPWHRWDGRTRSEAVGSELAPARGANVQEAVTGGAALRPAARVQPYKRGVAVPPRVAVNPIHEHCARGALERLSAECPRVSPLPGPGRRLRTPPSRQLQGLDGTPLQSGEPVRHGECARVQEPVHRRVAGEVRLGRAEIGDSLPAPRWAEVRPQHREFAARNRSVPPELPSWIPVAPP